MANYQVTVKAYTVVVVTDARDEEHAIDIAWQNVDRGEFELADVEVDSCLESQEDFDRAVRHANSVL